MQSAHDMLWRKGVNGMIEIIYKEESKKEEEKESNFQIPNNIRQIGESKGPQKIYMEDYVYTFLRKISRGTKEGKIAILLGEHHWSQGITYLFIKSALQIKDMEVSQEHMNFSDKIWGQVYEENKKYFPEQEILGWYFCIPGFSMQLNDLMIKTHLDYFAGNEKVLFAVEPSEWEEAFFIYENGQMNRQAGYYIYYEKNEQMQSYMIEMSQNKSIEETENVPDRAVVNFRRTVKAKNGSQEEEKNGSWNWAIGAYAAIAVFAFAIVAYNRSETLQQLLLSPFIEKEVSEEVVETTNTDEGLVKDMTEEDTQSSSFLEDAQMQQETAEQTTEENMETTETEQKETEEDESDQAENNTVTQEPSAEETGTSLEDSEETNGSSFREYTIQKGDTLTSISINQCGSIAQITEICRLNNISSEDIIYAGQKLILPEKE